MVCRLASALLILAALCGATGRADDVSLTPEGVLRLGPELVVEPIDDEATSRSVDFVPELAPSGTWPRAGQSVAWSPGVEARWVETATADGAVPLGRVEGRSVTWIASFLTVERFGTWTIRVAGPGALRLYVDGEEAGEAEHDEHEQCHQAAEDLEYELHLPPLMRGH